MVGSWRSMGKKQDTHKQKIWGRNATAAQGKGGMGRDFPEKDTASQRCSLGGSTAKKKEGSRCSTDKMDKRLLGRGEGGVALYHWDQRTPCETRRKKDSP